jgi:hypothetical protein
MSVVVVRPAGAGHETLWVALAAAIVLAVAALVIGARVQSVEAAALAPYQIDARTQLNAAEQGVHADLLVAAEEIAALADADSKWPPVDLLRAMELPPFATGSAAMARGGHEWQLAAQGHEAAYVGRSAAPEVAASFLVRLPARGAGSDKAPHGHDGAAQVWLQREGPQAWPDPLDDASLTRQGWRQVVVRYDVGVTRKDATR